MKATKNIGLILLLVAAGITRGNAQSEGSLYFMSSLPQYSINNPAFIPRYNFSIGLPGISSVATSYYNNGFSYNDLVSKSNGEIKADLDKWVKSLHDKNYILSSSQVDLLRIGFRINPKLYLQVSSTAIEYSRVEVPKELAVLFVDGTAPLVGTNTHFSPQAEGLGYIESAIGVAYQADEKLTLGTRIKYLNGIASATTVNSGVDVTIGNDYQISAAADLNMKTAGIHDTNYSLSKAFSNSGFAIDLGGTYKLTNRITLAASLIDLGKINWKNDTYSYTLDKASANYSFAGFDMKELLAGNTKYLQAQGDSISNRFKPKESKVNSFQTVLPAKMFLSGSYSLRNDLSVGALFFVERFHDRINPSGTLSASKHVGKWFSTTVSYTISNNSYNNFGAGLSFNVKPIQIYIVGDNLLGAPVSLVAHQNLNAYINSTQVFNLRFGVNFVWGRDKSLDKLQKNGKNVGGNAAGTRNEKVTDGSTKSLSKKKGSSKTRVTSGKASYLKVRKKH